MTVARIGRGAWTRAWPLLLAALLAPVLAWTTARADDAIFAPQGVALSGYDAVSYFGQDGPTEGSPEHALRWRGVLWYFATDAALDRFEMNPDGFAPQFGGYCAVSLADGKTEGGVPTLFLIRDGKLYLARDAADLTALRERFAEVVAAAEQNWIGAPPKAKAEVRITGGEAATHSDPTLGWGMDSADWGADDPTSGPAAPGQ